MMHFREVRMATIEILRSRTGKGQPIERAVIIDDIFGKVRVLAWIDRSAPPSFASDVTEMMRQKLGAYWVVDLWVASGASAADRKLYDELWETSNEIAPSLRMAERTRSRGFWMKPPSDPAWPVAEDYPPVIAFYSFKGGVGRTTTLASYAIQRARTGETVVLVDLDLDAPGVGTLLGPGALNKAQQFGVVDYLIELPLNAEIALSDYYHRCLDVSAGPPNSIAGSGQIFVFPAGSMDSDYVAMLARLDLEPSTDNAKHPLLHLLEHVRKDLKPDWILLDCRAGLSEASGFALSGLANLTVLLGTTSTQSWDGLRLVIERLGAERVRRGLPQSECLVVQTMTPENPQTAELAESAFRTEAEETFKEVYYAEDPADEDDDQYWYVRDAESADAPHQPSILYYSQRLAFIRSIEDVADTLAEDPRYSSLARRIASRFGKEPD